MKQPNCPVTGKKSYASKRKARYKMALQRKAGLEPTNFYKCKFCKLFHLTTKTYE